MLVRHALLAMAVVAACQSERPRADEEAAMAEPVASKHPAVSPPLPRLAYGGGRVIRHPSVLTVTFSGEDPESVRRFEAFGAAITSGTWWQAVTRNLCMSDGDCIGAGGQAKHARLEPPPARRLSVESIGGLVAAAIDRGALAPPTEDAVYLVYLPKGASLDKGKTCGFGGARARHATFLDRSSDAGASTHPYAVVIRCGEDSETMASAAHEVLEMATDPDLTGFHLDEKSPFSLFGTKAVDPCSLVTLDDHRVFADGYVFHRAWSNEEAAAGHDPCVPRPAGGAREAYFGAVPRSESARLSPERPRASVEWRAFSDRPIPDWAVSAVDIGRLSDGMRCLDIVLTQHEVNDGASFRMDLTLVDPKCRHPISVGLVSTLGTQSHVWPLLIER